MRELQVRNVQGRLIRDTQIDGALTHAWEDQEIPAGIYFARITADDGSTCTIRLIRTP